MILGSGFFHCISSCIRLNFKKDNFKTVITKQKKTPNHDTSDFIDSNKTKNKHVSYKVSTNRGKYKHTEKFNYKYK